jgi:spore maturation protein CgeB
MLTSRSEEQLEFFEEGSEILTYSKADELVAQVRRALSDPAEAKAMGERSYERVKSETYAQRALEILTVCGLR